MIEIYKLYVKGKYDDSLAAQRRLNIFLEEFSKNTKKDNFLQAADEKYVLKLRGLCNEYVTSYYRQVESR
jgi:4-hydroxy-tetrahydrodipicolinate synthase